MIRGLLIIVALAFGPPVARAQLSFAWTNNLLTLTGPELPGNKLEVWYLEAFCRPGSRNRDWRETTFPHKTELLSSDGKVLKFRTRVQPQVEVLHEVRASADEVSIEFNFINHGKERADIEWFQPACIRVEPFTQRQQSNYINRAFIYTTNGFTRLADTRRTEEALYRGGQVYVPAGINLDDANPRPISRDKPVNGLIGCISGDNRYLLATASDRTHELFEGVYVCMHSDPHVGGLAPGEKKTLRSKIYLLKNDVAELLRRYERDFGSKR
jgi:hypothetical protein